GLLGEPPVAVLRAPRPRELRLAHGEAQPRVLDGRALAARGRTDDGVPRQEVEPSLLASDPAAAQRLDLRLPLRLQRLHVLAVAHARLAERALALRIEPCLERLVLPPRPPLAQEDECHDADDGGDDEREEQPPGDEPHESRGDQPNDDDDRADQCQAGAQELLQQIGEHRQSYGTRLTSPFTCWLSTSQNTTENHTAPTTKGTTHQSGKRERASERSSGRP